jgi:tRNA pseudouridine55 synthase
MHSALKKDGQPLYKLARKGVEFERVPRPMNVSRLELLDFDGVSGTLSMDVSKGFYVRTLINDLGDALATGAVMTTLARTAIGEFALSAARNLDSLLDG